MGVMDERQECLQKNISSVMSAQDRSLLVHVTAGCGEPAKKNMIPVRCETAKNRISPATALLTAVCCAVYAANAAGIPLPYGFVPVNFVYSLFHPGSKTLYSLSSCAAAFFMHAGIFHLVSNMWYLWIFGNAVESSIGFLKFTALYLLCGAISMLTQAAFSPLSPVPVVGASGAIAGVMGLHLALLPFSKIMTWFPPIFIFRVPAFIFLLIWFYVQYVNAGSHANEPVAWWAHIGGFIAGVIWGIVIRAGTGGKPVAKRRK
jgi:membrane associated rhomboid family serine protease